MDVSRKAGSSGCSFKAQSSKTLHVGLDVHTVSIAVAYRPKTVAPSSYPWARSVTPRRTGLSGSHLTCRNRVDSCRSSSQESQVKCLLSIDLRPVVDDGGAERDHPSARARGR